jgi:hypothetical protein
MSYLEELKQYFAITPKEKVAKDFDQYNTPENNVGPTVNDFLINCQHFSAVDTIPPSAIKVEVDGIALSSKFSSDFFLPCI